MPRKKDVQPPSSAEVIAKNNKSLVKLVPVSGSRRRAPGSAKGQITISPDFDAPLKEFADYR